MVKFTSFKSILSFCVLMILSSCSRNKIETDKTLKPKDKAFIRTLNLLEQGESIYKFYSEYEYEVAGNFFTDRRIATYWIDEKDESKNKIEFAFYPDIISIDTVYYPGLTYCSFMQVRKKDSTQFKVCIEGSREQIKAFFEDAMQLWNQRKDSRVFNRK